MKKNRIIRIVTLIFLTASAAWSYRAYQTEVPTSTSKTSNTISSKFRPKGKPNAELSAIYNYEYSVQGSQGPEVLDFSVYGDLHVRILLEEQGKVYLGMQLQNASIQQGDNVGAFDFGVLLNIINKNGEIVEQISSKFLDESSKYFIQEQFNIQAVAPPGHKSSLSQWSINEVDNIGRYKANYKILKSGTIYKEKSGYSKWSKHLAEEMDIIQSFAEITLGGFWLHNYESMESIQSLGPHAEKLNYTEFHQLKKTANSSQSIGLLSEISEGLSREQLVNIIWDQRTPESFSLADVSIKKSNSGDRDFNIWLGSTLTGLIVNTSEFKLPDTLDQVEELRKWLVSHPKQSEKVYLSLRKNSGSSLSAAVQLISLLEFVSATPQAQSALAKIISDESLPWNYRLQGIISTGGIGAINNSELLDALWGEALRKVAEEDIPGKKISDACWQALSLLAKSNPVVSTELEKHLTTILSANDSTQPANAVMAIEALQNIDNNAPETYKLVAEVFEIHSDNNVRLAALDYIAEQESEKYSDVVISALEDQSKEVRLAAAKKLLEAKIDNKEAAVYGLINRLASEDDIDVKGAIYLALSPHRNHHPEIEILLDNENVQEGSDLAAYLEEAFR